MINYTQQDYERDVAIRDGAPGGATHFDDGGNYESPFTWYRYTKSGYEVWMWEDKEWRLMPNDCIECPANIRSLSDIKALIAAFEREQELTAQIEFKIKECMELAQSVQRWKNALPLPPEELRSDSELPQEK